VATFEPVGDVDVIAVGTAFLTQLARTHRRCPGLNRAPSRTGRQFNENRTWPPPARPSLLRPCLVGLKAEVLEATRLTQPPQLIEDPLPLLIRNDETRFSRVLCCHARPERQLWRPAGGDPLHCNEPAVLGELIQPAFEDIAARLEQMVAATAQTPGAASTASGGHRTSGPRLAHRENAQRTYRGPEPVFCSSGPAAPHGSQTSSSACCGLGSVAHPPISITIGWGCLALLFSLLPGRL